MSLRFKVPNGTAFQLATTPYPIGFKFFPLQLCHLLLLWHLLATCCLLLLCHLLVICHLLFCHLSLVAYCFATYHLPFIATSLLTWCFILATFCLMHHHLLLVVLSFAISLIVAYYPIAFCFLLRHLLLCHFTTYYLLFCYWLLRCLLHATLPLVVYYYKLLLWRLLPLHDH